MRVTPDRVMSFLSIVNLCTAAVFMVATAGAGPGPSPERQMPACKMGLIWPNASDGMGMLASLSRNECALTALQNHQNISNRPATGEGIAVGYSYCEVSKDCGCLAGSDFCMIWTSLGPPVARSAERPTPASAVTTSRI